MTLTGLWQHIDAGLFEVVTLIDGDPPVVCTVKAPNGKLIFVDLRNWYRVSFDELAEVFTDTATTANQQAYAVTSPVYASTIRCYVIEQATLAMFAFVKTHDLGNWRTTVAAQSMQLYRHRLGPRKIITKIHTNRKGKLEWKREERVWPLTHDKTDIQNLERAANYGGADIAFFVGSILPEADYFKTPPELPRHKEGSYEFGPVYHLDVNSLYPYVMAEQQYPAKMVGYNDATSVTHLAELMFKYVVLADVCVNARSRVYPKRMNNRVVYAKGVFWTLLIGAELADAMHRGEVDAVGYHVCYDPMYLFGDYVDELYPLKLKYRDEGNKPFLAITKLLLNSLYGKFSQKTRRWETIDYAGPFSKWSRWVHYNVDTDQASLWRSLGGSTQRLNETATVPYGMPCISAAVTAAAREVMRVYRERAGELEVYYQGTDALLVTKTGYDRLLAADCVHPSRLGALRLIGEHKTVEIRGPQDYTLDGARVTRGLPETAEKHGDYTYSFQARRRLPGVVATKPSDTVDSTTVVREYNPVFHYGYIKSDGWVLPVQLGGDNEA
jgi:hypothetical protein